MLSSGSSSSSISNTLKIKPSYVSAIRPNQDGSHGNLFNIYHLHEVCDELNGTRDIFYSPPEKTVQRSSVAVVICVYNEEWYSLRRTLDSLTSPLKESVDAVDLDIAIVIDGLEILKPCMKEYLHTLFGPAIPLDADKDWKMDCMTVSFKSMNHGAIYKLLYQCQGIRNPGVRILHDLCCKQENPQWPSDVTNCQEAQSEEDQFP